jgi:hypothetical protein
MMDVAEWRKFLLGSHSLLLASQQAAAGIEGNFQTITAQPRCSDGDPRLSHGPDSVEN